MERPRLVDIELIEQHNTMMMMIFRLSARRRCLQGVDLVIYTSVMYCTCTYTNLIRLHTATYGYRVHVHYYYDPRLSLTD